MGSLYALHCLPSEGKLGHPVKSRCAGTSRGLYAQDLKQIDRYVEDLQQSVGAVN